MTRLSWFWMAVAAGMLVSVLPLAALAAGGPGSAAAQGAVSKAMSNAMTKEKEKVEMTGVYRFISGADSGNCGGMSFEAMMWAPPTGGAPMKVLSPRGFTAKLTPGHLYEIKMDKTASPGVATPPQIHEAPKEYTVKPGEDQPGVYLFGAITEGDAGGQKRTGIEVSKFGQTSKVWLPNVRDENKQMVPDPKMLAKIKDLKKDDPIKIDVSAGQVPIVKSLSALAASQEGEFVEVTTVKVGGEELVGATLKNGSGTVTAVIPKTGADAKLAVLVKRLKAGQAVTFSVRKEGDQTWLEDIKVAEKKAEPVAKKPA